MPQQQPVELDEQGNPIYSALDDNGNPIIAKPVTAPVTKQQVTTPAPAPTPTAAPKQGRSLWEHFSEAPEFIMDPARKAGMTMTEHTEGESMLGSMARGFGAGALESIASMLSPLNIATLGKGKYLGPLAKVAGGLQAAHGVGDIAQGSILPGMADVAFGSLGVRGVGGRSKVGQRLLDLHAKDIEKGLPELNSPQFTKTLPQIGGKSLGEIKAEMDMAGPSRAASDIAPDDFIASQPIRPQFNPRKQTGMTGSAKPKLRLDAEGNLISKGTGEVLEGGIPPPNKPPTGGPPQPPDMPPPQDPQAEGILQKIKDRPQEEQHPIRQAWNLAREMMPVDLPFISSAGFRQALPMAGTKAWFKAWVPSMKSYGSKAFADAHDAMIHADPLMERRITPVRNEANQPIMIRSGPNKGSVRFKEEPSIIDLAGVRIDNIGSGTEGFRRGLAERIPGYGRIIAANNRAYQAYLKDIRLNAFRNFYDAMPDKNNLVELKKIGDAVNTFTGAGPLRTSFISPTGLFKGEIKPATYKGKEITFDIERHAEGLAEVLFAPKLLASRMQMLNPVNYVMASPQVRKMYMIAALRTVGAWYTVAQLGKLMGANVTLDPTSSDFGKVRVGKTRLDPGGGFQQLLVLAARMGTNKFTQAYSPGESIKSYEMGATNDPYKQTRGSVATTFLVNKLHPQLKYFIDAAFAKPGREFGILDRTAQLAVPMMAGDIMDIIREDPNLLPLAIPGSMGMGVQNFGGRETNKPVIVPSKYDYTLGKKRR